MPKIFLIFILIFLFSCRSKTKQNHILPLQDSTVKTGERNNKLLYPNQLTAKEAEIPNEEYEAYNKMDSLRLVKVLQSAMSYADSNKKRNSFSHKFYTLPDDSSYSVNTEMEYGYLFAKNRKHLIVRRFVPWGGMFDVFLMENNSFKNVCKVTDTGLSSVGDTLRDINGDDFKDFLVWGYPTSGCCPRESFSVFLYQSQTGQLTTGYELINASFFPKEKIIRGLEYGHPGEVPLYKYKWNGLQVDTIEFIYPYLKQKGKFIKYNSPSKKGIVLKSLPKEYRKIGGIDWFLDY